MSGFWLVYGSLLQLGWMLLVMVVTYLLFLLDRRNPSRLSRVGMGAAVGWLVVAVLVGGFQMSVELAQSLGIRSIAFSYVGSPLWRVAGGLNGVLFLVASCCFLGLAVKARRGKSRVARADKT